MEGSVVKPVRIAITGGRVGLWVRICAVWLLASFLVPTCGAPSPPSRPTGSAPPAATAAPTKVP
ncbi:MAG: hypothetical protein EBU40_12270 [Proteobacteria bacterium]|nr:hypothetical protein [Pseudomonadota bacterium]NCV22305.1 hypothetical protein [Chloroflexota bacterium]NBQ32419.1 hypothetical protein [Pseudomonadota bacterium]NBQ63043.1 hypothetical protein [Pseudomonadota bacterium]NBT03584.1 hypothetical protein [Pseudomonadota bacterium]